MAGRTEPDGRASVHAPRASEPELTPRAVLAGALLGGVVATMNLYFGLRTGLMVGGSLLAAILAYALFAVLRPRSPLGPLENNVAQTTASAAGLVGTAAGLTHAVPALDMLGQPLGTLETVLWAAATSFVGIAFAIPLRRRLIVHERLAFPSGSATARTIVAMHGEGGRAARQAGALLRAGLAAAALTLAAFFVPELQSPPMEWVGLGALAALGFSLHLSPALVGAGVLVGPRVAASMLLGALLAWGVGAPAVKALGWVSGPPLSFGSGARGWLLWPGVALMVADSLTALALAWRSVVRTFRPVAGVAAADDDAPPSEHIPGWAPWAVLLPAAALTAGVAWAAFGIAPWLSLTAVAGSAVLAAVATRAVGETDINPIGGVAKVTQLAYGALAPASTATNLMAAGLTGAGATQAGDLMNDLKTGHLLGASPRRQLVAQLAGVPAGIAFSVPLYFVFDAAYEIGGDRLPAPSARSWRAVAELFAEGPGALPPGALAAATVAAVVGVALSVASRRASFRGRVPSALAVGLAFLLPAYFSLAIALGAGALSLWRRRAPAHADTFALAVASGLIAGEGLMGAVTALLTLAGLGG